ncbi:hypothetical protein R1flu_011100 [Riccia fluitans]|uniref:SAP domain-containing protein n=1 Tax=Riccia fluitans TaxID=41844 RepID=A0ABD1Z6V8_9MARC
MVTLTHKQVGSSWKIETAALEQALTLLEAKGLAIVEVIHDDNTQEKRRSPNDSTVECAETIVQAAVFSVAQLKDYCWDNGLQQTGSKLQLVQHVSMHLKLLEASANTEIKYSAKCRSNTLNHMFILAMVMQGRHNTAVAYSVAYFSCKPLGRGSLYMQNPAGSGETHKAVADFLKKYITENKMKCYVRARENFISETFHSMINKFATKRIHFDASHTARLACAAMDWNENIQREVRAVYHRASNNTAVRRRAKTNKALVDKTLVWKTALANRVFI